MRRVVLALAICPLEAMRVAKLAGGLAFSFSRCWAAMAAMSAGLSVARAGVSAFGGAAPDAGGCLPATLLRRGILNGILFSAGFRPPPGASLAPGRSPSGKAATSGRGARRRQRRSVQHAIRRSVITRTIRIPSDLGRSGSTTDHANWAAPHANLAADQVDWAASWAAGRAYSLDHKRSPSEVEW